LKLPFHITLPGVSFLHWSACNSGHVD